jgi:hypothetical protein
MTDNRSQVLAAGFRVYFGGCDMQKEYETLHDDDSGGCIHHWLISSVNLGVCKKCGESKQFCSWWEAASLQLGRGIRSSKVQHNAAGTKS